MKQHHDQKLKEVMKEMLSQGKLEVPYRQQRIKQFWKEKMGQLIVSSTSKVFLNNRCLTVQVTSAPLRQELQYHRKQIIEKANNFLGEEFINDFRVM